MAAAPDKVDMSLDDIICLNNKERQMGRRQANGSHRPFRKKGAAARTGGGGPRGGAAVLRNKRVPIPAGRRRGQGVITGLAARRPAVLLRRAGALNRSTAGQSQKTRQNSRPFAQRSDARLRRTEIQRRLYLQPGSQRGQNAATSRRPFQPRWRPPLQQAQREARQATFLLRRGLKVQAQVPEPNPTSPSSETHRWRTSAAGSGILTVSIDNPKARTQPEPPTAWTLHPKHVASTPIKTETVERKDPKGVALQFDINSVGKPQTSMTLSERFRILKDQRAASARSEGGSGRWSLRTAAQKVPQGAALQFDINSVREPDGPASSRCDVAA